MEAFTRLCGVDSVSLIPSSYNLLGMWSAALQRFVVVQTPGCRCFIHDASTVRPFAKCVRTPDLLKQSSTLPFIAFLFRKGWTMGMPLRCLIMGLRSAWGTNLHHVALGCMQGLRLTSWGVSGCDASLWHPSKGLKPPCRQNLTLRSKREALRRLTRQLTSMFAGEALREKEW